LKRRVKRRAPARGAGPSLVIGELDFPDVLAELFDDGAHLPAAQRLCGDITKQGDDFQESELVIHRANFSLQDVAGNKSREIFAVRTI
jgi:hypothetical protein